MTGVHAVLLIPAEGHEALLASGLCGARPPTVRQFCCFEEKHYRWSNVPTEERCSCPAFADDGVNPKGISEANVIQYALGEDGPVALPLMWEGEVVPDGIDRAHRALRTFKLKPGCYHVSEIEAWDCAAEGLAYTLEECGFGEAVVIGADGRDVTAPQVTS